MVSICSNDAAQAGGGPLFHPGEFLPVFGIFHQIELPQIQGGDIAGAAGVHRSDFMPVRLEEQGFVVAALDHGLVIVHLA